MKANELRIGNIVDHYIVKEIYIDRIYGEIIKSGEQGFAYLEHISGIPLTEEWLLKFGFIKEKETCHPISNYYSKWLIDYKYSFGYADFRDDWGFYHSYTDAFLDKDNNKYDFISCGIKHVHQLQNLYFALTGTELTVK